MTFKKGDKVRTEDGHAGEILFVDRNGLEAQVALERVSVKICTDTLTLIDLPAPAKRRAKSMGK
jgi:preprotein translocase subunit YajC